MPSEVRSLKIQVCYLMCWQLLIIAVAAILITLVKGLQAGWSVALGGLCYWLPTFAFALRLFAQTGARAARRFVMVFFLGEMAKLFISAMLFVLVAKYLPVTVLEMLVGFIVGILAFWLVLGLGIERIGMVK